MPRQIWNEGRVVGYSAYEVYLKHALSVDPDHEPATEKEWLASMMAMGSSMLLRIGADIAGTEYDGLHYVDIQFPADSRLCAANIIIASFFDGEGYIGDNPSNTTTAWATKVTSYGSLIKNDSSNSPNGTVGHDGLIPPMNKTAIANDSIASQIKEYMKIVDGIIIQPGTWINNPNKPPQKDFTPTLSEYPRLRIAFSERVTTPFFLLLTGFTNRSVVDGVTGFETAVNTQSPADGDFLGPWAFPWSAKVIFSVPSSFVNYFMNNKYKRQLKSGTTEIAVKSDAIIDLKQNHNANLQSTYFNSSDDSLLPATITDINVLGDDAAVFATYMHSNNDTKLPPALYAALLKSTGTTQFEPVDSVAPGSLHLYGGDTESDTSEAIEKAKTLESEAIGTTAFMRDEGHDDDSKSSASYVVYELNQNDIVVPVSDDYNVSLYGALSLTEPIPPYFCMQTNTGDPANWFSMPIVASWRIFGNVSKQFETDFALSPTQITAILNTTTGEYASSVNSSMYDSIPDDDRSKYYYVLTGPRVGEGGHNAANYWIILPIRKIDGHIDVVFKRYYESDQSSYVGSDGRNHSIIELIQPNYTTTTNASAANFKYVGGWWNGEGPADNPTIYDVMPEEIQQNSFIQDKDRKAPKSTSSWVSDYKNVTLQALATSTNLDISHVPEEFRSLSLLEIVNKARLYKIGNGEKITYEENGKTYEGRHEPVLCVPNKSSVVVSNGTVNFDNFDDGCVLIATITAVTENKVTLFDIPRMYQRTDGPLASVGVSGNNHTLSLSIADEDGNIFNVFGTAGDMKCDEFRDNKLHWADLVECLASGKSMDLLGPVLRGIASSSPSDESDLQTGNYMINISKNSSGRTVVKLVKQ